MSTINIIADSGGGITLQVLGDVNYEHYFQSAAGAAESVIDAINGDDATTWDGNDLDNSDEPPLDPSDEDIRNGGYRVLYDVSSIHEVIEWGVDTAWGNISDLSNAVHDIVNNPEV